MWKSKLGNVELLDRQSLLECRDCSGEFGKEDWYKESSADSNTVGLGLCGVMDGGRRAACESQGLHSNPKDP